MTYFEKIEAYLSGAMDEMEKSIFEEALAENTVLQKEYEAYQAAQDLFNFTAEKLSAEEIITSNATETADQLINFTAQNLSEAEILGTTETLSAPKEAIVRTLETSRNRIEWLVAASMVFILSLIGSRFYNSSAIDPIQASTEVVVEKTVEPNTPTVQEVTVPESVITEPQEKIVKKVAKEVAKKRPQPRAYEPAKVRITPKVVPVVEQQPIAIVEKAEKMVTPTTSTTSKPMAVLTKAEKIVTGKVINKGEAVVYKAGNSITLKPGFHAKAGADFVATSLEKATVTDLTKVAIIEQQQSVVYNAANSITLKPGFHAKAGSNFVAATAKPVNAAATVSTNMVISQEEEILIKADETVTLKPGFHAKAGAGFVAKVKQ